MTLHEFFLLVSEYSVIVINFAALLVILYGTAEAFFVIAVSMFRPGTWDLMSTRYVRFGRWLVGGLTFQLAADIIETATTTTDNGWEDVARLAAIAVVRTFLSYFLERDMKELEEMNRAEHETKEG